jgi:RNA polymerase sigma-70 factor (ECF subfamily)
MSLRAESAIQEAPADSAPPGPRAADVPWPELVSLVRRTVRRIVGPSRDLDDLTQTALERVVRGMGSFEGRSELTTFVYRIAVNVALSHWRWWRRWLRRFDPSVDPTALDAPSEAENDQPYATHAARERAERLHRLLERLEPTQRAALVLADFEDLPAAQIAEILGCGEPTARSRLRLARNRLAALVLDDPFFAEEEAP